MTSLLASLWEDPSSLPWDAASSGILEMAVLRSIQPLLQSSLIWDLLQQVSKMLRYSGPGLILYDSTGVTGSFLVKLRSLEVPKLC